jgi:hypothetical protein
MRFTPCANPIKGAALPKETFSPPAGFRHFTVGNTYIISATVFDRRMLLTVPPLPHDADLATDWYWALSMGTRGKLKFVREPMGYYRVHGSNAANSKHGEWRKATYAMLTFSPGAVAGGTQTCVGQASGDSSRTTGRHVEG